MKKLLIALLLVFIAMPAKADDVAEVLIGLFLIKEIKEEFEDRGDLEIRDVYVQKAEDYIRAQQITAQMNIAIKKRQLRNCVERFECDDINFDR